MTSTRSRGRTRPRPVRPGRDRFEAKRLDLERRAGLRRLRIVLGLTAVTSLAVGLVAFVNSSWFDVDTIAVRGTERADPVDIVAASGIEIGQGLLDVDTDAAARDIELVPWIGTATVKRPLNGELLITVEERPPSAAISAAGRFALVDEHGRQLEIVDRRPDGYLPIQGIEGSGVAGEPAPADVLPVIALLGALPPEVEAKVSGVVVGNQHLYLELVDGGRADFGDGSQLGEKLQSFETMLARVDLVCLDTIDVRVPAAPVVTRDNDVTGSTATDTGESGEGTTQSEPQEEPDSGRGDC